MSKYILNQKSRSGEKSRHGISLAVHHDRLFVAWTGTDDYLNIMSSSDGGRSFDSTTKHTLYEKSYARPVLASFRDRLYLAWAGTDGNLNLMSSADEGRNFDVASKQTFWEQCYNSSNEKYWFAMPIAKYEKSPELRGLDGPSLAVYQDRLYLAWAGTDRHLNMVSSTDGGKTLDSSTKWLGAKDTSISHERIERDTENNTSRITSSSYPGPVLAVYNDKLHIAWTGTDTRLNVMTSTDAGRSFDVATKQTLKQYAHTAPALASLRGVPVLVWSKFGSDRLHILSAAGQELLASDTNQAGDTGETAHKAPAVAAYHDQLYVAWVDGWSEEWGGYINLACLGAV